MDSSEKLRKLYIEAENETRLKAEKPKYVVHKRLYGSMRYAGPITGLLGMGKEYEIGDRNETPQSD